MMTLSNTKSCWWLAIIAGLALSACGGGNKICEAGTVEVGGKCVAEIDDCGPGTILQSGQCVPACPEDEYWNGSACAPVPDCAPGTVFDPGAGDCLPACGDQEFWDGETCVPICAQGTVLDETTGSCVPGPDACAPGTVLVDGVCQPDLQCGPGTEPVDGECLPIGLPDPDVVESADPDLPATFGLPAEGQTVTLGGLIDTPTDTNGDGYTDGDWDTFAVTAPAGTWLRILATSEGATLPAFLVMSTEVDEGGNAIYVRYAMNPNGLDSVREVYLPIASTYLIMVTDYANFLAAVFGYGFIPVGGEDFSYFVSVENLGSPTPTDVAGLPLDTGGEHTAGALDFFRLNGLVSGEVVSVRSAGQSIPDSPSDVYPALLWFEPSGQLEASVTASQGADATLLVSTPVDGDYLLVQDMLIAVGSDRRYELEVIGESVADCATTVCGGGSIAEGERAFFRYDLVPDDLFLFNATVPSDAIENLRVTFYDQDMTIISDASAGPTWNRWDHSIPTEASRVYLLLEGWSGAAVADYTFEAIHTPLPVLQPDQASAAIEVIEMPLDTLETGGMARFDGIAGQVAVFNDFAVTNPGRAWVEPGQEIQNLDLQFIGPALDPASVDLPKLAPALAFIPEDGSYLHRAVDPGAGSDIAGGSYQVTLHLQDVAGLGEPLDGVPIDAAAQNLDARTDLGLFRFDATAGATYDVKVTPLAGTLQPEVWVLAFGFHSGLNWWWVDSGMELGLLWAAAAPSAGTEVVATAVAEDTGAVIVVVRDATGGPSSEAFDLQVSLIP